MLVTNPELLKKLYLDTYKDRLSHLEIKPEHQYLKQLREELFNLRLEKAKLNKSPAFQMHQLDKVLGKLKSNKAIDPTGLVNEMFQLENIGEDMKKSILRLINNIKEEGISPDFMSLENIVSIYKGKGSRSELDNDRGIFLLNIIRNIKDRLVYNEIYEKIAHNICIL